MSIRLVDLPDFTECTGINLSSLSDVLSSNDAPTYTGGTNLKTLPDGDIINATTLHIIKSGTILTFYGENNTQLGQWDIGFSDSAGLAFAVDDNTQRGSFVGCYKVGSWYYANCCITNGWDLNTIYLAITGAEQPPYTWSSVPAISGKNGILSLPTLIDTDGEPISGQSASVFSSLPEGSNVRTLINGAL